MHNPCIFKFCFHSNFNFVNNFHKQNTTSLSFSEDLELEDTPEYTLAKIS